MDVLPVEISQRIFALACTDGGYTGCSLSLTSRAVRAISRAVRFRSIHLVAYPSRLESFVTLYAQECSGDHGSKPKVQHLFLTIPPSLAPRQFICARPETRRALTASVPRPTKPQPSVKPPASASVTPGAKKLRSATLLAPSASYSPSPRATADPPPPISPDKLQIVYTPRYTQNAHRLVEVVSPHLETLVIQRGFRCEMRPWTPPLPFIDGQFPGVRDVTVLGLSDMSGLLLPGADATPVFPAATHLRLVRKGISSRDDTVDFWRTHAPRATHLYVTCLRDTYGKFVPSLAENLGVALHSALPPPERRVYASLRSVILQPDAFHDLELTGTGNTDVQLTHGGFLEHVEEACSEQGVKATVTEPCDLHFENWSVRLRDEWMDRAEGGAGAWGNLGLGQEQKDM